MFATFIFMAFFSGQCAGALLSSPLCVTESALKKHPLFFKNFFPNEKSYWGFFFEKRGLPDRSFFGEIQGERLGGVGCGNFYSGGGGGRVVTNLKVRLVTIFDSRCVWLQFLKGRPRLGGESQGDAGSGERRPFVWAPLQKNEPVDKPKAVG